MIFSIFGPGGAKAADKAKSKTATTATNGSLFAELLEGAKQPTPPAEAPPTAGVAAPVVLPLGEDLGELPRDTPGQTRELLKTLRELAATEGAADATQTQKMAERLSVLGQMLSESVPVSDLTDRQQQAVAETQTRAAVEAAKRKR